MKFTDRHPEPKKFQRYEYQYSYVAMIKEPRKCSYCQSDTNWIDLVSGHPICSEECGESLWQAIFPLNTLEHKKQIDSELRWAEQCDQSEKDILIVVHNQLDYLRDCIGSIQEHTSSYHLYIWDNASDDDLKRYLETVPNCTVVRSEQNLGFVEPNNELIKLGRSPYVILLNSDCVVYPGWDRVMIGFLQNRSHVVQIGALGAWLNAEGMGLRASHGYGIDYVSGWCFCIGRQTYDRFGLFNPELELAYFEDADLSLRLKNHQQFLYATCAPIVHHCCNKTIKEVAKTRDMTATFEKNHQWFKQKWGEYLGTQRMEVLVQKLHEQGKIV